MREKYFYLLITQQKEHQKYIDVLEENRELNKKMNLLRESNER